MPVWDRRARGKLANNVATNTSGPARATTSATPDASSLLSSMPESDVTVDSNTNGSAFVDSIIESAINNFFKDLSLDDQALFNATTISTQLLQDVQNADKRHQEHSVTRRVAAAIKPFVTGVEHYGTAWDVISNSNNLICPIWGSARIILKWASEFGDYFENLAVMFSQIGQHLVSIRRYPTLYPDNEILRSAMVDIFRAIFEFLTKAAGVFREGQKSQGLRAMGTIGLAAALKVFWKPFKVQFGDSIDRISRSMQDIETEVEIAEKELASKERQKAEVERVLAQQERDAAAHARSLLVQERFRHGAAVAVMGRAAAAWSSFIDEKSAEKVNVWLAPANVASNHNAATKARHADSGSWFLEGNTFQQWLEQRSSFLWLHAIPGAGKTVLSATIINYLQEHKRSTRIGVAYFYCDYRETQKREPLKVLSTILSMLSTQNRKVFLEVQAFFQAQVKQNPAYIPEFDELVSNFEAFVRNHFERVLIVVDALDECSERDCLAYALKHIYRNCTNVQILVTSRNEIDIARTFEEFPQSSIKEHDVALDIEKFVKAEISTRIRTKKLKLRDEQLADTIAESLVEGAKGMFQWVKCQIEHLCKLRNDKAIRRALKDLPKTLHDTYIRILEGIQEQSEDDIHTVQRVLRWLVRSARNMSLDELAECISIDPIGEETRMEFDAVTTDPEDVLEICGSLVSVSVDNYVSIAHYSAKEFLVSEDLKKRMPNFWVGGYEVESALATVCLKYLCYDDFAGGTLTGNDETVAKLEEYKALKYASHYWATHAFRSKKDGHQTESVVDLTMRLFGAKDEEGHKNFEQWKQIYYFKSSARSNLIPRSAMNPLSFASCFGLTESVQQLLRAGAPADCSVNLRLAASQGHIDVVKTFLSTVSSCSLPNSHTAFYAAAAQGHVEIVQLLLDEVITDINVRAGKDGTALQAAALEGRYEIVSLLLDRGADAKFPCKRWGTPLAAAAEKGHFRTVEVLLDHGVNPNGRGGWCCFPLISAVMGKNAAIIDLLLQRGANVNAQGGCHGCALMAAASKGMVDLVSKLVDFGAKVNDEDDKGSDALYAACTAGHLDVVNLLLQLGADVNAKGGKHRNALNAASAEGKVEIVKRLIEVGADIQVLDEHVGNALQLAAWKGHDDIVRIISDAGVDVNESGGQRGSALVAAATRGHDATIRLLFELGVKQGDTQEMVDALVFAAHEGHQSTAELLLGSGLTVEGPSYVSSMANPSPRTALEAATRKGHIDIVKLLIAHGTDVNSFNEGSSLGSPLLAAIDTAKPCIATINILLDAGADPNLPVESTEPSYGYPLPAAVITGNLEIVKLLIARGAKINEVHGLYFTAMQFAAGQENPIILDYFLSNGGDVNLAMVPGANYPITPLQQAAHDGQEANVRKLISLGAELSVDNEEACYKNALQAASAQGHVEVVRTLVELGCDVNEIGGYYGTSLIAAARFNHSEVVELLIDADAQVNIGNVGAEPMNALIAATLSEEDTNVIPLLIQKGADPNMKGGGLFQYPLHAAAEKNLEETVRHLIENGADVNATGGRYMTALQAAALHSHSEVMQILLENSANPCIIGGQYGTALTAAYTGGWVDAISILYKYGADNSLIGGCRTYHSAMGAAIEGSCQGLIGFMVNHCGYNLNLPYGKYGAALQHAIANERGNAVIDLFLRNGADVNNQGGHFGTPLTAAVYRGDKFAQEALFEHGADPTMEGNGRYINAMYGVVDRDKSQFGKFDVTLLEMLHSKGCDIHGRDDLHGTLIQRAAFNRKFNVVKKLVQWGVDPDAFPSSKYGSALQAAATSGHSQMLRYLVRKQINVNCKGGRLGNPLSAAVISCSTEDIEILLKKGADPNQRGGRYGYPLQAAALLGRVDVILLLLRYGSAINAVGGRYGTALQAAVVSGSLDAVKLLIEQAADPDIEAGMYRTALHAAALERCVDILGYLIDAGALITPIDRQRLVHQTAADLDAAEELLKDKEEVEDEVNDEEVDEEEEEVDEENEDKDDDDDEEENDSDEFNPLPWNVTSIPGFDELYAPAQITAEVVQRHISVDEEVLSDSVSDEESAIEKFLELTTVFEVVLVDVFE